MPRVNSLLPLLLAAAAMSAADAQPQIQRLNPTAFRTVPGNVRNSLLEMGCTIPQDVEALHARKTVNVIRGRFVNSRRSDFAALCSRAGLSKIVVIHSMSGEALFEFEERTDESYTQSWTDGTMQFSRRISRVTSRALARNIRKGNGAAPERWREGIDDYFVGKASTVHYHQTGGWRTVTGAD